MSTDDEVVAGEPTHRHERLDLEPWILVEEGVDRHRPLIDKRIRIAVIRGTRSGACANISGGSRFIIDDD
jgi:hypothetical protein